MKTIGKILLSIVLIVVVTQQIYQYYMGKQFLTRDEFYERINEMDEKNDRNFDTLKIDVDSLKTDTRQLKKGQEVIYDEIKKSNEPFWQKLLNR